MTNQMCPACYSTNTKVRHINGVPELLCHDCGYDSADKNHARRKKDKRERETERGKGNR